MSEIERAIEKYVMIYDKGHAPAITRRLRRWTNNKRIWRECERFEDYGSGAPVRKSGGERL